MISALIPQSFVPNKPVATLPKQPEYIEKYRGKKRLSGAEKKKRWLRYINRTNQKENRVSFIDRIRTGALAFRPTDLEAYKLIQGMTNWQNYRWLKAGGIRDIDNVRKYAKLSRR